MDDEEKNFRLSLRKRIHAMHGDIEPAAKEIGVDHTTLSRWGNPNYNGLPTILHIWTLAKRWSLSPAYLGFGQGPDSVLAWDSVARLTNAFRTQPEPVQRHLFESLRLPYQPLPTIDTIRFTASAVARRLASAAPPAPVPRANEDPAHYGRKLNPKDMKRLCEIVGSYIENKTPIISSQEADDLRYMLSKLRSIVDDLPKPPARDNRAGEPSAGDAAKTGADLDPPQTEDKD
jgi:hypothetical protein